MQRPPFHLAIQVRDIEEARDFYGTQLEFPEGRSAANWIDFNMFGHQLVTHFNPQIGKTGKIPGVTTLVDGHAVPVPHFGIVMDFENWELFAKRARGFVKDFIVEPYTRFSGEPGEQRTMFFADPSGNALEFKAFRNIELQLFAK